MCIWHHLAIIQLETSLDILPMYHFQAKYVPSLFLFPGLRGCLPVSYLHWLVIATHGMHPAIYRGIDQFTNSITHLSTQYPSKLAAN